MTNRLGIIGGGQLARMLAEACHRLGIVPVILCDATSEPAAQIVREVYLKADEDAFYRATSVVTFENEFVDVAALSLAQVRFFPSLANLAELQNKLSQKQLLGRCKVPSPPFRVLNETDALEDERGGFVLKWATLGYDGRGTFLVKNPKDSKRLKEAQAWTKAAHEKGRQVYLESFVDFEFEAATLAARNSAGEIELYPPVRSRQSQGVCEAVWGPLSQSPSMTLALQHHRKLLEALNYVGVLAIEWFVPQEGGEWLVNELAPRVHNTGHVTQESCITDQFENHVRAVMGRELGSAQLKVSSFAMRNLFPVQASKHADPPFELLRDAEIKLHWYGKTEARMGRKMGHINLTAQTPGVSERLVERLDQLVKKLSERKDDKK